MEEVKCEGMFTVRHIKDNWYFEVPDTLLGRLLLAVTRFKAVPQGFKMLSGEEVNRSVVYWEQHDDKTLFYANMCNHSLPVRVITLPRH